MASFAPKTWLWVHRPGEPLAMWQGSGRGGGREGVEVFPENCLTVSTFGNCITSSILGDGVCLSTGWKHNTPSTV
jgi:hypothetical protein